MSDGACCHYCRKYNCECPDPVSKSELCHNCYVVFDHDSGVAIGVEPCPLHSLVVRLADALRTYAEKTTLHSIRNGWGVFNSPGPELAKDLVAEYDAASVTGAVRSQPLRSFPR